MKNEINQIKQNDKRNEINSKSQRQYRREFAVAAVYALYNMATEVNAFVVDLNVLEYLFVPISVGFIKNFETAFRYAGRWTDDSLVVVVKTGTSLGSAMITSYRCYAFQAMVCVCVDDCVRRYVAINDSCVSGRERENATPSEWAMFVLILVLVFVYA